MILTIRFSLEYGCYPLWLIDETGGIIDTQIVDEIKDSVLDKKLQQLQIDFENHFINTASEFSYIGFDNKQDEAIFVKRAFQLFQEVKRTLSQRYEITLSKTEYQNFLRFGMLKDGEMI